MVIRLVLILLLSCKQTTQVKVSAIDDQQKMLDSLADKIIGYYPDEFANLKQQLQDELGSYNPQKAQAHYRLALKKMLASDAYIEDGFFHLHRHQS